MTEIEVIDAPTSANSLVNLDFINALFCEVNPVPVKEAMNMLGMNVGGFRLPLCEMEESNRSKLKKTMENVGIL